MLYLINKRFSRWVKAAGSSKCPLSANTAWSNNTETQSANSSSAKSFSNCLTSGWSILISKTGFAFLVQNCPAAFIIRAIWNTHSAVTRHNASWVTHPKRAETFTSSTLSLSWLLIFFDQVRFFFSGFFLRLAYLLHFPIHLSQVHRELLLVISLPSNSVK